MTNENHTQWICADLTNPCKCSGNDDECCCDGKPGECSRCGAAMVEIDFNTGEPV